MYGMMQYHIQRMPAKVLVTEGWVPVTLIVYAYHTHTHTYTQDNELAKKFEDDARDVYGKAITGLMRENLLFNFVFADFEEVSYDQE